MAQTAAQTAWLETAARTRDDHPEVAQRALCFHCGTPCLGVVVTHQHKSFCCQGCLTVYELLTENGLGHFYDLEKAAGVQVRKTKAVDQYRFLDDPTVRDRLLDYADDKISRATFHIPSIHCIACVWLLENLYRLKPGMGRSSVNFPRKEVTLTWQTGRLEMSDVAALLDSLGYEPRLNLGNLEKQQGNPIRRALWLKLGVAGFAFGNIMLFSLSSYFGLEGAEARGFHRLFGGLSILLALPVLIYSASDYWRAALACMRQRMLTIELPIAVGLAALFGQSVYEIVSGHGEGYLDSLAGLIFFLLIGRMFQQKTYERLSFERDYKSFFPLSVVRKSAQGEETVPLSRLAVGDRLILRHGELIPADSRLLAGHGLIDYSFVTGESEPVKKSSGDLLYAGGQQAGGAIEVEITKPVSQSYLTSPWNHEAFSKLRQEHFDTILNRFSRRFVLTVAVVAVGSALWWWFHNPPVAIKAFTSVLIVACPCALALSAPFALGTAQRLLARRNIFLKNPHVIETLARIDTVVFDKTGTLTAPGAASVHFEGEPLGEREEACICELARHSTHPYCLRLADETGRKTENRIARNPTRCDGATARREEGRSPKSELQAGMVGTADFREHPGKGIEGTVQGCRILLGSAAWLAEAGISIPQHAVEANHSGSRVHVAMDGTYRGCFSFAHALRPEVDQLIGQLSGHYDLALLSGDNARERERFEGIFGSKAGLHFEQSPLNKLEFVERHQQAGRQVMMVGDGLNDAGALKQSHVGVAVVENIGAFSPASDVILEARKVSELSQVLAFSKATTKVVWLSIGISSLYNFIGLSIAAQGLLSPVLCAILMPISSISVVAFACGATHWAYRAMQPPKAEIRNLDSEIPGLKPQMSNPVA